MLWGAPMRSLAFLRLAPAAARSAGLAALALALTPVACGANGARPSSGFHGSGGDAGGVDGAVQLVAGDAGDAGLACQRVIDLSTDVTLSTPPPFDVVIVADNSDSLSWSHADLASGLQGLLTYVHGRDVRFFILTTTQYGQSSKGAVSMLTGQSLVTWSSSVSGAAYADPVTQYTQSCSDPTGTAIACPSYPPLAPVDVHGQWTFTMPPPIAAITASMTDAQIAAQQQAISSAMLGLVGGGTSEEQPICTLNRYIAQPPSALPAHAVFIVLSDEDDVTPPTDCLAGYDFTPQATSIPESCSANCSQYTFEMWAPTAETTLAYSCVPEDDDGTLHEDLATSHTAAAPGTFSASCASAIGACSAAQVAFAQSDCGSTAAVQNCTYSCAATSTLIGCTVNETSATPDICTQSFSSGGVTYANIADYCAKTSPGYAWSGCSVSGYNVVDAGTYESGRAIPVVPNAATPAQMIAHFKAQASEVFAPGAYQVETIQLSPSFPCPVNPGQSYGTTLATLATTPSDVFPICQSYAGLLQHVQSFADGLIQTSYSVPVAGGETVEGVTVVTSAGVSRTLGPGQFTYDPMTGTLTFAAGVLTSADASLHVDVGHECVPR